MSGSKATSPTTTEPGKQDKPVAELPRFGPADRLVLEEARARFNQEEIRNSTYQGKTSLFLAFSGFFSALIGAALLNLLDPGRWHAGLFQWAALGFFAVALGLLFWTIETLLKSSISPGYETPANPEQWRQHLQELRKALSDKKLNVEDHVALEEHLLDAWAEAVGKCHTANEEKAELLVKAARRLRHVLAVAIAGMVFFGIQAVARPAGEKSRVGTQEPKTSTTGETDNAATRQERATEVGTSLASPEQTPHRRHGGAIESNEEEMTGERANTPKAAEVAPKPKAEKPAVETKAESPPSPLPTRPPNISLRGNADPKSVRKPQSHDGGGEG
jgi:hypothetical protein